MKSFSFLGTIDNLKRISKDIFYSDIKNRDRRRVRQYQKRRFEDKLILKISEFYKIEFSLMSMIKLPSFSNLKFEIKSSKTWKSWSRRSMEFNSKDEFDFNDENEKNRLEELKIIIIFEDDDEIIKKSWFIRIR